MFGNGCSFGSLDSCIYNDPSVQGSDAGPVVYFRNQTGIPCSVIRNLPDVGNSRNLLCPVCLKKLEDTDMITLISYSGKHGSMVYLRNYLSVMFNISDVMIDKEENCHENATANTYNRRYLT